MMRFQNENHVPEGYHEQEGGADKPNYTDRNDNETWCYVCPNCLRAQTYDSRPVAGQKVRCADNSDDGCGSWFNLTQSRLYAPKPNERFLDTYWPVIET